MTKEISSFRIFFYSIFLVAGFFVTTSVYAFTCGVDTVNYGGKNYQTVQLGAQCWFKENLNVGIMLPNVTTVPSNNSIIEKWCYDDSSANCTTYGGLYTWAEANGLEPSCNSSSCVVPDENQGICPNGWHIPADDEYVNGDLSLVAFDYTHGGFRHQSGSAYMSIDLYGYLWSSTQDTETNAWYRRRESSSGAISRTSNNKTYGFSVRCLQNATQPLEDTIIQNPDTSKISDAVSEGYIILDNGTIDNTSSVTTQVNVTFTNNGKEIIFPTGTTITEQSAGSFNFQNFTLESQNIKNEQPESRSAFRLGIEGTNLTFSQNITVNAYIGEAFNTQTLDILYQNEGETTWNTQGTCTVENGLCTFQTNHATIYTINGTLQSTGDTPLNINTEVLDTLTMDCYESTNGSGTYDVLLGTVSNPGYVTAGTPAIGQSTCTVTTNDDQGYYLTVEDDNGISSTVLTHTDPNTGTLYEIQDLTHWNDTTLTTENWNPPTTKGLGFSIITFPDTDTSNNTFDGIWTNTGNCPEGINPDSNDYAGIPDTPETIAAVPQYTANHTTTTICYKVDVPTSQPSGTYTGSVTYTATSDASSYVN
jgi:hypothetical protein